MKRTRWIGHFLLALSAALMVPFASAQRGGERHGQDDRNTEELREPRGEGFGGPLVMEDDPDRPDFRRPLSDDEVEIAREVVAALYPEMAERLNQLHKDNPRRLKQTLERRFPRVRFLVMLKQRDPEMYELRIQDVALERQTRELGKQIREARAADDKDAYKQHREQLESLAAEHFDVRQTIREREIEMLKLKLEELEDRLDDRADDRDDLIEQRVNELAGSDW